MGAQHLSDNEDLVVYLFHYTPFTIYLILSHNCLQKIRRRLVSLLFCIIGDSVTMQ